MIIKELISNVAILITSLFLYTQLTRSSPLLSSSSLQKKVTAGILAGVLSNILMQYSMQFGESIVDLRHIPLILVAYYGGSIPALITMGLIGLGRFLIGVNTSSMLALLMIVFITVATLLSRRVNVRRSLKVFIALTASNVIFTIIICYLISASDLLWVLIPSYWGMSYIAGFTSFYVVEYVRESQRVLEKYKSEAVTDALTGLNNVRKFDMVFNDVSRQAQEKKENLSLLFIDIDHFKRVNDTYGHKEGDRVLIELGNILKNTVRSFDVVSRNGGEEFTVILLDCPTDRGRQISERIRKNVEQHLFLLTTGEIINITVSIGLACFNETTKSPPMLLKDADDALYEAKKTGRNKVCVSSS
ncbi:diguanylate cyclase [Halobacillus litoralis]|uniref:GGDEF domain-containing protein n=1 Tax=Halobacillus litoralis TaxID=45668 RepID=UPI001CD44EE1|nr:diguanylate cyclase [Halobacillus litoralis]MCA0970891.1 diguanylate cyclase [Halobacillus litoralis]